MATQLLDSQVKARIPLSEKLAMEKIAKRDDVSLGHVVRRAIRIFLKKSKSRGGGK